MRSAVLEAEAQEKLAMERIADNKAECHPQHSDVTAEMKLVQTKQAISVQLWLKVYRRRQCGCKGVGHCSDEKTTATARDADQDTNVGILQSSAFDERSYQGYPNNVAIPSDRADDAAFTRNTYGYVSHCYVRSEDLKTAES